LAKVSRRWGLGKMVFVGGLQRYSEKAGDFIRVSTAILAESESHRAIMEVRQGGSFGSHLFPGFKELSKSHY
jgi:hypothetical protein